MHGTVWQWVEESPGRPGGSWPNGPDFLRSAYRNWAVANGRLDETGFRVGRALTP